MGRAFTNFIDFIKEFFYKYFTTTVPEMKLVDFIDIVILALLIYAVLRFISGRRAFRLLLGLAFLGIIWAVSYFLDLSGTLWLFERFAQIGMFAIVVIFQSDLRAGLERVGSTTTKIKKLGGISEAANAARTAMISDLSEAVIEMSRTKTGALIAIEGSTKLGDYTDANCTLIDAKVSSSLIRNIFYNGSPLHDGGVVIRGERVFAAGCKFPLSDSKTLSRELGTRHRAALGLSEVNSDVIVIVVSEETGIVSMAYRGQLKRDFDRITLDQELTRLLTVKSVKKLPFASRRKNSDENDAE